jgi:hypothetical protein
VRDFAERAQTNERNRIAYLRSLAIVGEWDGYTERATAHLREAEEIAEKLGLPGELWRVRAALGGLSERRGKTGEARSVLPGGADPEIVGREDRGRRDKGRIPFGASGTPRARA